MPNILPFFRNQPTRRATLLIWTIGVVCALSIAIVSYYVTLRTVERDAQNRFQNLATNAKHSIDARIKSYNNLLGSVAALFQTADNLDHGQFHRYISALDMERHFPAIDTLNYIEYVPQAQRAQFEARVRNDRSLNPAGNPDFAIRPAGVRPDYYVITYMEPRRPEDISELFGLDGATYPVYRKTLEWSRDTGMIGASGQLYLVNVIGQPAVTSGQPVVASGNASYTALTMRLPRYHKGMPLDSVAQRRAAYRGTVGVSFNVPKLMRSALDEMMLPDVHLMLFDVGLSGSLSSPPLPRNDSLIFDSHQAAYALPESAAPPQADADHFATVLPMDFNGRNWKAHFSVRKSTLLTGFDMLSPWIAASAGLLGVLLIYCLLYMLSSSRRRARQRDAAVRIAAHTA